MREESKVAAAWWANQFRRPPRQDNGTRDPLERAFVSLVLASVEPMSEEQIRAFEDALARRIDALLDEPQCAWDEAIARNQPHWGGARRYIGIDYHAPQLMVEAAQEAGITPERFALLHPIKTSMWINPGCVQASPGYQAPIAVIYGTGPHGVS